MLLLLLYYNIYKDVEHLIIRSDGAEAQHSTVDPKVMRSNPRAAALFGNVVSGKGRILNEDNSRTNEASKLRLGLF